ncbi:MAG: DUF6365 family protein [Deltaproteobacteria bacterium]|nr:DUF6365 family protein [Deltaproteobacteria bacterium]
MRLLFLAPLGAAFGEALHGVRIARALVARGHEVVWLSPQALAPVVEGAPVAFGRIDHALPALDAQVTAILAKRRCDALVLVDAAAVGKVVRVFGLDPRAFTRPAVPVVAIDCWNLPAVPIAWDYGGPSEILAPEFHAVARAVAVPIAPPEVAGGFAALPVVEVSAAARAQVRAELGISLEDRMIVWPTAAWQHAANHDDPVLAARAAALPERILPALAAIDRVRVIHVGPIAFGPDDTRYRHLPQVAPERYEALIAAADLLLSVNAVATSLATAVAASVPIVLGQSAARVDDELGALPPLRAWPLGLDGVLAPTIAGNPFYDAMAIADPLAPGALTAACAALLEPAAAEAMRARQAAYRARVAALPSGADQVLALIARH